MIITINNMVDTRMHLYDLLVKSAESGLGLLKCDGSMPAGHNGPHHDPETPVRTTSHWLVTFLKSYQITNEKKYKNAALQCIDYLTSDSVRPYGYTFCHRDTEKKDKCNGLIGQAWTIEALSTAGIVLNKENLVDISRQVFNMHEFDESIGLWKVLEINGNKKGYDLTLNHQIWFAAAGTQIVESNVESSKIENKIIKFLDSIRRNIHVYDSGLIYHNVIPRFEPKKIYPYIANNIKRKRVPMPIVEYFRPELRQKRKTEAVGYHSYNLYALAILKQTFPDHSMWRSGTINTALTYSQSGNFEKSLEKSKYSYVFNCTGIEMGLAVYVFNQDRTEAQNWLNKQFQQTYDKEKNLLVKNAEDTATLSARIYEAARLPNLPNVY
jgi:hypothetical protein